MRVATVVAALSAASVVAAHPGLARRQDDAPTVTDGTDVPEPTEVSDAPELPEETETPIEVPGESSAPEEPEESGTPEEPEEPEEPEIPEPEEPAPVDPSPFEGRKLYANPGWSEKLDETFAAFEAAGDEENAARVRTIQDIGTFVWVTTRKDLTAIDTAIENARAIQEETGEDHIIGLVSTLAPSDPFTHR